MIIGDDYVFDPDKMPQMKLELLVRILATQKTILQTIVDLVDERLNIDIADDVTETSRQKVKETLDELYSRYGKINGL
jgi:hypothetical protein